VRLLPFEVGGSCAPSNEPRLLARSPLPLPLLLTPTSASADAAAAATETVPSPAPEPLVSSEAVSSPAMRLGDALVPPTAGDSRLLVLLLLASRARSAMDTAATISGRSGRSSAAPGAPGEGSGEAAESAASLPGPPLCCACMPAAWLVNTKDPVDCVDTDSVRVAIACCPAVPRAPAGPPPGPRVPAAAASGPLVTAWSMDTLVDVLRLRPAMVASPGKLGASEWAATCSAAGGRCMEGWGGGCGSAAGCAAVAHRGHGTQGTCRWGSKVVSGRVECTMIQGIACRHTCRGGAAAEALTACGSSMLARWEGVWLPSLLPL